MVSYYDFDIGGKREMKLGTPKTNIGIRVLRFLIMKRCKGAFLSQVLETMASSAHSNEVLQAISTEPAARL